MNLHVNRNVSGNIRHENIELANNLPINGRSNHLSSLMPEDHYRISIRIPLIE